MLAIIPSTKYLIQLIYVMVYSSLYIYIYIYFFFLLTLIYIISKELRYFADYMYLNSSL